MEKQFIKSWFLIEEPGFLKELGPLLESDVAKLEATYIAAGQTVLTVPLLKVLLIGSKEWALSFLAESFNANN